MATTTMTAPMSATSGLWKVRAVQLANARNLLGTARHIGTNAHGEELWDVPSRSRAYCVHLVSFDTRRGRMTCDCEAFGVCSHMGAALHWLRMREQAMRQARSADEQMRSYMHDMPWGC